MKKILFVALACSLISEFAQAMDKFNKFGPEDIFFAEIKKTSATREIQERIKTQTDKPYREIRNLILSAFKKASKDKYFSGLSILKLEEQIRNLNWDQEKLKNLWEDMHEVQKETIEFFVKYGDAIINVYLEKNLNEKRFDLALLALSNLSHSIKESSFDYTFLNQMDKAYLKEIRKIVNKKYRKVFRRGNKADPEQIRKVILDDILNNRLMSVYLGQSLQKNGAWDLYLLQMVQDPRPRSSALTDVLKRMRLSDQSLVPLLLKAIQAETCKNVKSQLISNISKYRSKKSLEEGVLPILLESDDSADIKLALTIMGRKVQPQDRPIFRKFARKGFGLPLRLAALRALNLPLETEDAVIFIEALEEGPESKVLKDALQLLSVGEYKNSQLVEALLNLLVSHKNEVASEDMLFGAQSNLDRIRNALWNQKLDVLWGPVNQFIANHQQDHILVFYCLEAIGQVRLKEIQNFGIWTTTFENHFFLEKQEERKWMDKFQRDLKVENLLEQWLISDHLSAEEKEAIKKALWSIGESYNRCRNFFALNLVLSQNSKEVDYKKTTENAIQKKKLDELSRSPNAAHLEEETSFYLFLRTQLPENGEILPWKFKAIFNAVNDLYEKLPGEERVRILKLVHTFLKKQTWYFFREEWTDLRSDFSNLLNLDESEIFTHSALIEKLERYF